MYEKCIFTVAKYNPQVRTFDALSIKHLQELDRLMIQIEEWVYDTKSGKKLDM